MEIDGIKIVPGCIIDIADDKKLGRVKCDVPGIFVSSQMNKDGFPWIYPLIMPGYQRFSMPTEGQKVWVIQNTKNYQEFWYVPMQDLIPDCKDIFQTDDDYETADMVLARNTGELKVYLYYVKTKGLMMSVGEDALININQDGEVHLQASDAKVQLRSNKVYIGDGEDGEEAVLGQQLKSLLNDLSKKLNTLSQTASNSPYTSHLSAPILDCSTAISTAVDNILCKYTNVD